MLIPFSTNVICRGVLADKNGDVSVFRGLLAGLGSGITEAVLIVTPFEVIKIRLQQQKGLDKSKLKYKGTLHTAKTIFQEEGARSLVCRAFIVPLFIITMSLHLLIVERKCSNHVETRTQPIITFWNL